MVLHTLHAGQVAAQLCVMLTSVWGVVGSVGGGSIFRSGEDKESTGGCYQWLPSSHAIPFS